MYGNLAHIFTIEYVLIKQTITYLQLFYYGYDSVVHSGETILEKEGNINAWNGVNSSANQNDYAL